MAGCEELVKTTALDPEWVFQDPGEEHIEYNATYQGGKCIFVPINYKMPVAGLVLTAHWVTKIPIEVSEILKAPSRLRK